MKQVSDPLLDIFKTFASPLHSFFNPRSVAVIGATEKEGSVGRTIFSNLTTTPFGGTVYPVNAQRPSILGVKAYPKVSLLPEVVDLVVICTPAATVPALVKECGEHGIKAVVVISAGFKELGAPGIELEEQLLKTARTYGMRIIGPNCLGVMNPVVGLNATFGGSIARPGKVAFLSQSGALCTAILDWSLTEQVGFSAFVSIGSMLDVDWGALIQHFGNDPHTESIVIYMESIGNARSFLSAAREVALNKPIIVIKAGRTDEAAKAAASHTGSLTGSDEVLDVALARAGVLRVDSIADLFFMAEALGKQPRPTGKRLAIVTNAGGPGVLATDALIRGGGKLSTLTKQTVERLNSFLPPHWSRNNPVDILGDANAERYAKTLEIVAHDPDTDGMLVIVTPQDMNDATATAELLKQYAQIEGKPVIASWMGGDAVKEGIDILNHANIPTFAYPDTAMRVFNYMWQYNENLRSLYETPTTTNEHFEPDRATVEQIISKARSQERTLLSEDESKQIFAAYGIPVAQTLFAATADDAVSIAAKLGFPVVVKLFSKTITHKSDVGGVKLNLFSELQVREAYEEIRVSVSEKAGAVHFNGVTVQPMVTTKDGYELILGSSVDQQFGPVVLFGLGGQLVEVFKDRSLGLPPLNSNLVRSMLQKTKIYTALKGVRGRNSVDLERLEQILIRFSQLVVEQKLISECDLNPLFASDKNLIALDGRVVLYGNEVTEASIPAPAIRPYPLTYCRTIELKNGVAAQIRPIKPEDERALAHFHELLSEASVMQRYGKNLNLNERTAHDRLLRICFTDYDRSLVFVSESLSNAHQTGEIHSISRLSKLDNDRAALLTIVVADPFQKQGLGTAQLQFLLEIAQREGMHRIDALILKSNTVMISLLEKFGFRMVEKLEDDVIKVSVTLPNK